MVTPETFGQIACSVGRLPIRFTVGTGGTIRMRAQGSDITLNNPTPVGVTPRGYPFAYAVM